MCLSLPFWQLKKDIAVFLKDMHNLDYKEIKNYTISNKENVIEELVRNSLYSKLNEEEKQYIENFKKDFDVTKIFDGKQCLCHNDFSCNHLILDDNNKLIGIIDFEDAGIIDEYYDFIYLLEDSQEEIGSEFGKEIMNLYGNMDVNMAIEYNKIVQKYYQIETIV